MSTVQPLPCPSFMTSRTRQNLRSACLGEMQARRLYLDCAKRLEADSLHVIAHAFHFTAAQEKEHADVLRGLLSAHGEPSLPQPADEPPILPRDPVGMLRAVVQSEHDEWDRLYPFYARIALEEGYPRIATAFRRIAEKEQEHAMRFLQYMEALSNGTLFRDDARTSWFCLPCGQLHTGHEAPSACSGCGRDRGHFIRSSYHPFAVEG